MKKWTDGSSIEITLLGIIGAFSQDVTLTLEKKPTPKSVNKKALGF
jgi:hypothetical protein